MANRRTLKKYINYSLDQLAIDCLLLSKGEENAPSLLMKIFTLQEEMIKLINNTPKEGVKAYYREMFEHYRNALQEIADEANK